jgi:hypothetical protein
MLSQETDHVSPTEVHPSWAKGLWALGGLSRPYGGRLDKNRHLRRLRLRRRSCGQTGSGRGVYEPAFKPLQALGRPTDYRPRLQTGLGKSDRPAL